jgi:hypothetical protein
MELLEKIRWDVMALIAIGAWVGFAEHPSASNARTAIIDTLSL